MNRQKYLLFGNIIFGSIALILWFVTIFNKEVPLIYPLSFNIVQLFFLGAQILESKSFK